MNVISLDFGPTLIVSVDNTIFLPSFLLDIIEKNAKIKTLSFKEKFHEAMLCFI